MADRIPIAKAEAIGVGHRYDQVIILARRVGEPGLEWVTTWGRNPEHCGHAARIGEALRDQVVPTFEAMTARIAELEAAAAVGLDGDKLKQALDALRPFAEAAAHLHPAAPDDGTTLDGFTVAEVRLAARVYATARSFH